MDSIDASFCHSFRWRVKSQATCIKLSAAQIPIISRIIVARVMITHSGMRSGPLVRVNSGKEYNFVAFRYAHELSRPLYLR